MGSILQRLEDSIRGSYLIERELGAIAREESGCSSRSGTVNSRAPMRFT